ncbi:facilitated glucose transporter [Beauveria bassiana ARSEF 2860]|uniref:Facilitated glucose transporter n=1 Tax=Beauveria bassiana (strain ARSEF 2860) TaxID=655819 RepID=J5JAB4_BEAB2|nr:facilitated glucose transporter [Beauveria bassiana ARSEF 2860]EJP60986.1 facilitated glucose transporter [Beauveria bassiana ARSEF 2860]
MEKKISIDSPDSPSAEHVPEDKLRREEFDQETGGRRQSVAHNIIQNPLKRKSEQDVVLEAEQWANSHGMEQHASLFGRAALVARDPENFELMSELPDDERQALIYERNHKWHGPKMLWYSISLCAIGAATQGWDQTGANGANLSFPEEFNLTGEGRDEWIVGLINSIIFLTAGLIGAFIVDPLNHYLGRRGEIFLTAACLTATPIGSAFATNWQGLFWARFIMGIGIGAKNATVPIYSAEMAPHRIRGALVMFWQLWVVVGIFLGFVANIVVKDVGKIAWRLQFGSAFIPSFLLLIGIFFCPESPRWLMKHGKFAKGFRSMQHLRAHDIIAARDYYYSYVNYEEEKKAARGAGYIARLKDCFVVPRIRRANYGASTVMLAQQISSIFTSVGYTATEALYASLGYGAVQVVATIPTLFLIDTKGRRTLTMITFPLMCIFLLAAGLSLLPNGAYHIAPQAADQNPAHDMRPKGARIGPVVLFVYLFTICYSLGEGPVAFQYSAEVFPTIQREQGMAWAVCINNTFAGILGLTFPRMKTVMTSTGAFGFYAGLNLIAWGMIFCFVRETKQLTLEEIDQQVPWFIKRYIFFRNIPRPPPVFEKEGKTDGI